MSELVKKELNDVNEAVKKLTDCRVCIISLEYHIKLQDIDSNKSKVKQLKKELKTEIKREKLLHQGLDKQITELALAQYANNTLKEVTE